MDGFKTVLAGATLTALLTAVGHANAQTARSGMFARGAGSAAAQSSSAPGASNAVFVAPKVGVSETARPVANSVSYEAEPGPEPMLVFEEAEEDEASPSPVPVNEAYAESSVTEEKAKAAEILAKAQQRAEAVAAKKRRTTRPINVPMTLGALKDKPTTAQSRPAVARTNAATPSPQYLQYAPNVAATQVPGSFQMGAVKAPSGQKFGTTREPAVAVSNTSATADELGLSQLPAVAQSGVQDENADEPSDPASPFASDALVDDELEEGDEIEIDDSDLSVPDVPEFVAPEPELNVEPATAQGPQPFVSLPEDDEEEIAVEPELDEIEDDAPETLDDVLDKAIDQNQPAQVQPEEIPEPVETPVVEETAEPEPVVEPVAEPAPETAAPVAPDEEAAADDDAEEEDETDEADSEEPADTTPAPSPGDEPDPARIPYGAAPIANTPAITCAPETNPAVKKLIASDSFTQDVQSIACGSPFVSYAPAGIARPEQYSPARTYGVPAQGRRLPAPASHTLTYVAPEAAPAGNFGGLAPQRAYEYEAPEYGVCKPVGLIGGAEWLSWKTDSDFTYAKTVGSLGTTIDERDLKTSGSGLRGRIGYRGVNGWDVVGVYTWYQADDSGSVSASNLSGNATLVAPALSDNAAVSAIAAKLDTKLQNVDLEIGRWNTRENISFRPFAGFRWTSLELKSTGAYSLANSAEDDLLGTLSIIDGALQNETAFSSAVADSANGGALHSNSRLNAYGLRIGADLNVEFAQGLSIYGRGAGAIAAGDVKAHTLLASADGETYSGAVKKTYATPSVEGALGVSWKRGGLEARAGYEFNAWYNASNMNGRKSDFLAHGYVAGLGWNY